MNVLYYGFVREKFEILKILEKRYNWNPSFLVANKDEKNKFKDEFLSENFAEILNLRLAKFEYKNLKKIPIGKSDFEKISDKIVPLLLTLKDPSNYSFPIRDRLSYFREMFNYWNSVLKNTKVDCLIFYTWPHTATCYSLYLIAKYIFKKKILFIDVIEHFDDFYHTVGYEIEDLSTPYTKYIEENLKNDDVDKYIKNIIENKKYKRSDHLRWRANHQPLYPFKILFEIFKSFLTFGFLKNSGTDWKNGKKEISEMNTMSYTKFYFFKLKMSLLTYYYEIIYKLRSISLKKIEKNFILYVGQYQPEAASTTFIGYYQDTFAVFDILKNCKSKNDKIIYKEHPDTFMQVSNFNTPLYKDLRYWKKLFNIEDLITISHKENIYEAIDKSSLVVTTNSTTAIEGVIRGRPVLLFGNTWYSKCEGIFQINNFDDCINAFDKIKSGYKPNIEKVRKYLNSVAKSCSKGIIHDKFYSIPSDKIQENNNKIASLIFEKYIEYYS